MDAFSFQISSLISENIKVIVFLCLITLGLIFFIIRTNSFFSLLYRLVILLFGKPKSNLDLINDIVEIERFNFLYKKDAVSIKQKEKFEKWIRDYELDFKLITSVGKHLDIDALRIKKITKRKSFILYLANTFCLIILLPIFIFSSVFLVGDFAMLSFKSNDKIFLMNTNEAKGFSLFDTENVWFVDSKICENKTSVVNLSGEELSIVCDIFSDKDDVEYIDRLIHKQRLFLTVPWVISMFFILFLFNDMNRLINRSVCRKMIYRKIKRKRLCR